MHNKIIKKPHGRRIFHTSTQQPTLFLIDRSANDILTSGVANVVRVSTDAQILIDASLDAVAGAAETDVDTAMNETWCISAAVDC